ncbi:MAG: hypothetical protein JSW58_13760, partial [Candidatus Latescibacterota bacterium]
PSCILSATIRMHIHARFLLCGDRTLPDSCDRSVKDYITVFETVQNGIAVAPTAFSSLEINCLAGFEIIGKIDRVPDESSHAVCPAGMALAKGIRL